VTVGLVAADFLVVGAGSGLDQIVRVVVDAQGRVVDFDGDDLALPRHAGTAAPLRSTAE
jgi:hypothetical protein